MFAPTGDLAKPIIFLFIRTFGSGLFQYARTMKPRSRGGGVKRGQHRGSMLRVNKNIAHPYPRHPTPYLTLTRGAVLYPKSSFESIVCRLVGHLRLALIPRPGPPSRPATGGYVRLRRRQQQSGPSKPHCVIIYGKRSFLCVVA